MGKTIKGLAAAALLVAPLAADNLENPLFVPRAGGFYSKTAFGMMSKEVDDSPINKLKGIDGDAQSAFRLYEDAGYGLTDRLSLQLSIGYTDNSDAEPAGMHQGRLGLLFRALGEDAPLVWDVYCDIHLGGVSALEADLSNTKNGVKGQANLASQFALNYKNYTTGQWGVYLGTRIGQQYERSAWAAFAEICQKFAGDNNEIAVNNRLVANLGDMGNGVDTIIPLGDAVQPPSFPPTMPPPAVLPPTFSVELASSLDYNFGFKYFHRLSDAWSLGATYTYKYHADNEAEAVLLEPLPGPTDPADPRFVLYQTQAAIIRGLRDGFVGSLKDGYDEHILNLSLGYALGERTQLVGFFEYTSDAAFDTNCQNTTASKYEFGLRLNLKF
jgi:hypothetical protein